MRIGLLVAMDKEFNTIANSWLSKAIEERKLYYQNGCRYMKLQPTENDEVIIMQCGIGKVNGAIGAMTLAQMKVNCIISSGVAGGASPILETGNVVVGKYYQYHDVYCGDEVKKGQVQGELPYFMADDKLYSIAQELGSNEFIYGTICTGDQFVDKMRAMGDIVDNYPDVLAVDMESCAIAQVCNKCNIPFISYRILSDVTLNPSAKKYEAFWDEAPLSMANNTMRYVMKVIREYKPF